MKNRKWIRKGISALLALNMVLSLVPLPAFAVTTDNLCEHHTEHTADCGYAEGSAGQDCTHEHSEECYAILECLHTCGDECADGCAHECTVESGCITRELDCHHTHGDCGYVEAVAPQDCTICQPVLTHAENCGYVAPVAEVTCACVSGEDGTLVHTEGCGYVAPVEEVKCACVPTVTHGGEGCTYVEGKAGAPCTHTHAVKVDSADSCYKLLCSHKDGGHDDACGYVASVSGSDCTYHCHICHVQTLVDALPVEVTAENVEAVTAQLTAIDEEKASLSDEELAQVDFAKYTAAISAINALEGQPGAEIPAVVFSLSVTVDGIAYSIEVESSDTIEAVKTKITAVGAVLVNPKLYLGETELEDGRTLADYSISADSAVSVTNYYNISIAEVANGTVYANPETAPKDGTVTLTVTADDGYKLNTLTATYGENQPVTVAEDNTFTMPAANVTVTATFQATCACESKCTEGGVNSACAVCSAAGADLTACVGAEDSADAVASITSDGTTTYYDTLAEAAAAVTEGDTIEVLTDVTIGEGETLTFAAFATLNVAEGKNITCNGTVKIGDSDGIIFENTLYYYGGDVTQSRVVVPSTGKPYYFKAGKGYIIGTSTGYGDTATGTMKLVNATVNSPEKFGIIQRDLTLFFSGTNTITTTGGEENIGIYAYDTSVSIGYVTLSGEEGAVLNISADNNTRGSTGIYASSVTVTGGTVNITTGNSTEGGSFGINASSVTVEEGATLNLTVGEALMAFGTVGPISGGTVNGLIAVPADNAIGIGSVAASGNTVLIADFDAVQLGNALPFTVPSGTSLTVNSGVTLDLSSLAVADIDFSGTVINNGTILLPEGFDIADTPKGGTVQIGESVYTWDSENNKWNCADETCHTGGAATCTTLAICGACGESYGELGAHTPDAGGKCTAENCGYQYPAKVGDTFYETIHKALRAAEGNSGCTLTLLDDIILTSTSSTASYVNMGTFTLDLNGKNLSSNKGTLNVLGSADLTIKDSTGGGKIVSTGSNAIYQTGGTLTIESGSFEGTLDGVFLSGSSTLIVKGGTFVGSRAMITGFGSDCVIDLTAIDPTGYTLKNNGSGTFAPKLPEGYGMVDSDGKLLASLSAEQSATVHKHEYKYTDLGNGNHQQACSCGLTTGEPAAHSTTAEDDKAATCIAPAYCSVCDSEYGDVDKTNHDSSVECVNGFCENGCYEPATLNAEGFYEIFNAGQLYWFAQQVNIAGNTAANGKLMADIDLEGRTWYPIGVYNDAVDAGGTIAKVMFKGTLDGGGHTVSNFTATGTGSQGLVGYSDTTVVVKNLGVINATVSGWNAGAVLAYMGTVENCYAIDCKVTGYTTAADAVGVYAGAVAGSQSPTVKNSFAYNCQVIAGAGMTVSATLAPVGGELVSNSYYVNVAATNGTFRSHSGEKAKTTAQFASGEVAYLLGTAWGQTIDAEDLPVLGGKTVYEITICEKTAYSNTDEDIPHNFDEKGFCTNIEGETHYQPALDSDSDGFFEIGNAGQLFWFANHINTVDRTASAVLTADIDLEGRPWTPIGSTGESSNNFRGTFDGQNHTIKGLYVEGGRAGLGFFGEVRTGTVKNFTIYGNVVVNTEVNYVGGVIGSICGLNGENDLERNGAIIQNITSFVNVTAKAHGIGMIGGFVGYANHQSLIEKCAWYGTFDAGEYRVDSGAGGFIGKIQEDTSEVTIRNCGAYGTIKTNYAKNSYNNTPTIYMGGFLSFSNTNAKTTLENCLFAGRFERGANLTDAAELAAFGTLNSVNSIKNCYYLGDDGLAAVHSESPLKPGENIEITSVTGEQLKSGEVAWLLNGSQSEGVWKQNVGIDPYPSFTGNPVTKGDSEDMPYYNDGVVRVNISWTEMSFTYTVGQWDPETHTSSGGGWTADKENGGQITVTNSGGTNVPVSFTFQGTMGDVSGIFTVEKAALAMGQSVTTTLSVTGDPKQSGFQDAQIGTVTVSLGSSGWAVGDKVTMYAKDGNDYVSTVAEVTGSKAVLVSDTSFSKNYTPSTQEDILALVDGPGARWPIYGEAAFTNIIHPWLVDKLPESSGYSGNTYSVFINNGTYRWLYKGSSGSVNQNVGNWKIGYKNTWIGRYIWDIPFAN